MLKLERKSGECYFITLTQCEWMRTQNACCQVQMHVTSIRDKPPAELYFTNRNTTDLDLVLKYSFLKILPGNCLLTEFDSVVILSETYGLLAANTRHEQLRTIMGFNLMFLISENSC